MSTVSTLFDVARRTRQQLFDELNRYWSNTEIIDGINSARTMLYALKPRTYEVTEQVTLVAGYRQTLPNDSTVLFRPIENVTAISKRGITPISLELLTRVRPRWRTESPSTEIIHLMYVETSRDVYEVYPPAVAGIKIMLSYAKRPELFTPADLEVATPILLSEERDQADPIVDYACHRCLLKEADSSPTAAARSREYLQLALAKFTGESSGGAKSNPNTTAIGGAPPKVNQ